MMSDNFDPDAWPGSSGSKAGGRETARRNDEDYDAVAFDDSDDDYSDSSTFDDYGYDDNESASTVPMGRQDSYNEDVDDYDRRYAGDSYDDDYDDDYDREPNQDSGIGRKLVGALAALAVIGALAFGVSALLGGGGDEATETAEQPALTNLPPAEEDALPPPDAPPEVSTALDEALLAWGEFAVSGDLNDVRPYFVNDGPQFDRFQAEAPEIQSTPPGGGPLNMDMTDPQAVQVDENNWLMRGIVTVTRDGEPAQSYPWEVRLTRQSEAEPWQILSVRRY